MSSGWAKASACRLQVSQSCAVLCHIVSLQYLFRSSHLRLSSFLVIWSPRLSGETRGPSVVFEAVDVTCPGPLHLSSIAVYVDAFWPFPAPHVALCVLVCDVEHASFHFSLCGRRFIMCLFVECPCICTRCHIMQHTWYVHLSLQADSKVAFEDSRFLAFGAQPAMILRCFSLSWLFALRL